MDAHDSMTPSKLVRELDKHIVSQKAAKRTIAQAVRNKYRMRKVQTDIRSSMRPSNILIHGRSGSGKTEIFRRIAKIYNAPFMRVEATRYTEVGYHGDDIRNIIVDLFKKTQSEYQEKDASIILRGSNLVKEVIDKYLLKCILGGHEPESNDDYQNKKEQLENGLLEEYECYLQMFTEDSPDPQFQPVSVKQIREEAYNFYLDLLFNHTDIDQFLQNEIETKAIVIIDEIDKIVRSPDQQSTTKASDEGVQYDLLPLLDGTTVKINSSVKINTKNILFVGAGAFEKVKPTELAIELQGRMPVKAKMETLGFDDFVRILKETEHSLLLQAVELLKTEGVNLAFEQEAIDEMARVAVELNEEDNIGARRLRTVLDAVLEEINFEAPDFEYKDSTLVITKQYVTD